MEPHGHGTLPGRLVCLPVLDGDDAHPHHVDVWCPPGYDDSPVPYASIYAHDGQNLFDPTHAIGGVDWGLAETIDRLCVEGLIRRAIVVAVWNRPSRWRDYMPQWPLEQPAAKVIADGFELEAGGPPESDAHVRFLADRLKPLVDARFRTSSALGDTLVMGSSMGGLISLYTLIQRPDLFGAAACLSTHWTAGGEYLVDALAGALPSPESHRLYLDRGTLGLDAGYAPLQGRFDQALRDRLWVEGRDWESRVFEGADHREADWRDRVQVPLRFLLPAHVA